MDRNILDEGLYNVKKKEVRTKKVNLLEQIALMGSASMAIVSLYYMYCYMPNYYNVTSFISESIVFVTIFYWSRITKKYDDRFSKNKFDLPPFVRRLRLVFIFCVGSMIYKVVSSFGFLFSVLVNLDFELYSYYILFTIVDGFLVSVYSYYLVWIFKTEKQMLSINKENPKQSFFMN